VVDKYTYSIASQSTFILDEIHATDETHEWLSNRYGLDPAEVALNLIRAVPELIRRALVGEPMVWEDVDPNLLVIANVDNA
jgi:hypothetical protein